MTKVIAILISAIFFFGLGDKLAFTVKKAAILKVSKGLPPLSPFTREMVRN